MPECIYNVQTFFKGKLSTGSGKANIYSDKLTLSFGCLLREKPKVQFRAFPLTLFSSGIVPPACGNGQNFWLRGVISLAIPGSLGQGDKLCSFLLTSPAAGR